MYAASFGFLWRSGVIGGFCPLLSFLFLSSCSPWFLLQQVPCLEIWRAHSPAVMMFSTPSSGVRSCSLGRDQCRAPRCCHRPFQTSQLALHYGVVDPEVLAFGKRRVRVEALAPHVRIPELRRRQCRSFLRFVVNCARTDNALMGRVSKEWGS